MKVQVVNKATETIKVGGVEITPNTSRVVFVKGEDFIVEDTYTFDYQKKYNRYIVEAKEAITQDNDQDDNDLTSEKETITTKPIEEMGIDELKVFAKENNVIFGGNIGKNKLIEKIKEVVKC